MLAQITENVGVEGVTLTYSMMVLTIGVALFVELVKVILSRFVWFTADMKKPFLPLLSIGITMAVFRATGQTSWLLAGVILGWSASGGYDWVAGTLQTLGLKSRTIMPLLILGVLLFNLPGCAERIITPAEQFEFANFNIRVQDWSERCKADPNTCARGLANMAAEMQTWTLLICGGDPNRIEVAP